MKRLGPLHVRDDEEPDITTLTYQFAEPAGWCGFCGRVGHRQVSCPDKPLSDFSAGAKKSHKPS